MTQHIESAPENKSVGLIITQMQDKMNKTLKSTVLDTCAGNINE